MTNNVYTNKRMLAAALPPLLLAAFATAACWHAAGVSLGLFFGGFVVTTLLLPPFFLAHSTLAARLAALAGILDGVALVFLAAILRGVTVGQFVRCWVLLIAYGLALAGLATLLRRLRVTAVLAGALTMVVACLWLAWPVWLSPWLLPHLAAALVSAHPLLAVNGIFTDQLGIWTERGILYRLTTLGQDIPYLLPRSLLPALLIHLAIGLALLLKNPPPLADAPDDQ